MVQYQQNQTACGVVCCKEAVNMDSYMLMYVKRPLINKIQSLKSNQLFHP